MGQEIGAQGFSEADFAKFRDRLTAETDWLRAAYADGKLAQDGPQIGLELEACCWSTLRVGLQNR